MRGHDIVKPVLTLDTNGLHRPTYALSFNPKKHDLLATGDSTGIQVRPGPGHAALQWARIGAATHPPGWPLLKRVPHALASPVHGGAVRLARQAQWLHIHYLEGGWVGRRVGGHAQ